MKVTATRAVYLEDGVRLDKGQSADVDGRTYGDDHMFIKAGYLVKDKQPEQPKQSRKQKQEEPKEDSADKE